MRHWLTRNVGLYLVATTVSTLGTSMVSLALTFALLLHGQSTIVLGLVLAAQAAPTVLLTLPAGAIADRWSRRGLMIGADLLRCASQGLIAVLMSGPHPSIPLLIVLVALIGTGNAFYGPAEFGLIPLLVEAWHLHRVNSLLSLAGSITAILGPMLSGLLIASHGPVLAIGFNALTYAFSALCLARLEIRAMPERPHTSFAARLATGWAVFRRLRWLQLITMQYGVMNLAVFAPFLVLGPASLATASHGARSWGIVSAGIGVGGILAALILLVVRASRPLVMYEVATAVSIIPLLLLLNGVGVPFLALGGVAFGAGMVVQNLVAQTTIQRNVPEEAVSRVSAIFSVCAQGMAPVAYASCGLLAHALGTARLLAVGSGIAAASVIMLLFSRSIRILNDRMMVSR
ncbi:MFS transporter [Nguyenibacter vanlangensis]|uniref:MFS transporter n=1 Tax=Nguyenibacter vanlangensis TaxID=1216886 RepID=A0A7Y7ISX1_9PROT|nr:MFS transporter [Nguyenibacter vanlangensis]NVN09567.1 MFS transporter [Nguyenibacter vanlangensis]